MKYREIIKCDLTVKNLILKIITLKWNNVLLLCKLKSC